MKQTGNATGSKMGRNPGTLMANIAVDVVLSTAIASHIVRKMGPGEYLKKRVSEDDRELLKSLTSDDIQGVRPEILILGCSQDDCKTCALRFDKNGNKLCTLDHRCMFHDNWKNPHPSVRKRRSVWSFKK